MAKLGEFTYKEWDRGIPKLNDFGLKAFSILPLKSPPSNLSILPSPFSKYQNLQPMRTEL
jgi:hypothetical protein